MREYGKVFSRIWESEDFRALTEDGRTLALYLLTCQHATISGVFRVPDGYASEDLQWTNERVAEGFRNLASKGFATRCDASKWVWVTKHLEWNPPENPNQRKAAAKMALAVPDSCCWKPAFMRACGPSLGIAREPEAEPLGNPSSTVVEPVSVAVAGTVAVGGTENRTAEVDEIGDGSAGATPEKTLDAPLAVPPAPPAPVPPPPPPSRGERLSADWVLPEPWCEWALGKYPHWTPDVVRETADSFRDFWVGKTGKDATKFDWEATWRNWCRNSLTHRAAPKVAKPPAESFRERDAANAAKRVAEATGGLLGAKPATQPLQEVFDVTAIRLG